LYIEKEKEKKNLQKEQYCSPKKAGECLLVSLFLAIHFFGECLNKLQPYIFSRVAGACK
jgi:hypothetical protein